MASRCYKDFFKVLFALSLCCFTMESNAQSAKDTLQLTQKFSDQGDFESAINILKTYNQHHPQDVYAIQLLALNYYWNGQLNEADTIYRKEIEKNPQAEFLTLDYARMLYELNQLKRSKLLLDNYILEFPDNIEALEYLGYIHYWWGKYKTALDNFNRILRLYPNNPTAIEMIETIELLLRPYLFTNNQYSFDSQPLQSGNSNVEIGRYFSPVLKPIFRLNWLYFVSDDAKPVPWAQLGNEFNLFKNKTRINAEVGVLRNNFSETELSGLLELKQKLTDKLSMTLSGESRPYFYTLSSLQLPVSFNAINAFLHRADPKGLSFEAFTGKQFFMDGNEISNSYLWAVSPYFGWKKIKFNLGYSYSLTNSTEILFESKLSLDEILTDYMPGEIEGVYVPYFTPANQNIHSIISTISLFSEEKFQMQIRGNISVFAYADIPYLFLNKDDTGEIFIDRGFSKEERIPLELSINATYHLNRKIALNATYTYVENFFYYNNIFNLNLKFIF